MSIATVVTRGYGSFGSINKLPTLGYSQDAGVRGPIRVVAAQLYRPGMMAGGVFRPGAKAADVYRPGAMAGESVR